VNRIEGYNSNSKSDLLANLKEFRPELDTSKVQLPGDWDNKGNALYNQGKYDEAIQAYDRATEIDPQYTEAWDDKGEALKALEKTTEANDAFAKAKELGYKD